MELKGSGHLVNTHLIKKQKDLPLHWAYVLVTATKEIGVLRFYPLSEIEKDCDIVFEQPCSVRRCETVRPR